MELYSQTATDSAGNVVNGASVSVTISSSGLPATIYDKDGIALSNPFLTGYDRSAGEVEFQAANDLYDITVTGNSGATKTNQSLADPGDFEAADTTILKDADIGVTVQEYDADIPTVTASQAEMEAGTETANRTMNPAGVKQAIDALGNTYTSATETTEGIIEIATQAEVDAGTDTSRAVTPDTLNASPQVVKAWVNFNGTGTVAIRDSFNVSSITDNGVGDYTVNLTNAMNDINYAALCSTNVLRVCSVTTYLTGSVGLKTSVSSTAALEDRDIVLLSVFAN